MIRGVASTIVVVLNCGVVAAGIRYASTAAEVARGDRTRAMSLAAEVNELKNLRARSAWIAPAQRPAAGMIGQVSQSLLQAGLKADLLTSLTPQHENTHTVVGGARYGRQSFRLQLEPLTLPDLGRWLAHWKQAQPQWTVSAIELTPLVKSGEQLREGQRPTLRAGLTLDAVFVDPVAQDRRSGT